MHSFVKSQMDGTGSPLRQWELRRRARPADAHSQPRNPARAAPPLPNRGSLDADGAKSTAALFRLHSERGSEQRASITPAATLGKYNVQRGLAQVNGRTRLAARAKD